MTPQEVLLAAADLIERDGWCQGTSTDAQGRHCVLGAIWSITGKDLPLGSRSVSLAFPNEPFPADWNDAPSRRKAQVIARLRKAAGA